MTKRIAGAVVLLTALVAVACDPEYDVTVINATASPIRFCVTSSDSCSTIEVDGGGEGHSGGVRFYERIALSQESSGVGVGIHLDDYSHQTTAITIREASLRTVPADTGVAPAAGFSVVLDNARSDSVAVSLVNTKAERYSSIVAPGDEQTLRIGRGRELSSVSIRVGGVEIVVEFEEGLHQGVRFKIPEQGTLLPAPAPLDPKLCVFTPDGCPDD